MCLRHESLVMKVQSRANSPQLPTSLHYMSGRITCQDKTGDLEAKKALIFKGKLGFLRFLVNVNSSFYL